MPRITMVANDHDIHGKPLRYLGAILGEQVTRSFVVDLQRAVEADHDCNDSGCDIREAHEQGFTYVAAYLLQSATDETPHVSKVIWAHRFNRTIPANYGNLLADPPGWNEWLEHFKENGVKCDACGTYNFDSDTCSNCLATLPDTDDDKE